MPKPQAKNRPLEASELRPGLYHLRYTDKGIPGGIILQWKSTYGVFTLPGPDTHPMAGYNANGQLIAWDPLTGAHRFAEARPHWTHAGISGPPKIRERDRLFSDIAALRQAGKPYSHLLGKYAELRRPLKAHWQSLWSGANLDVEILGVTKL